MSTLVVVLAALGLGFFVYSHSKKDSGSRIQFFSMGKDAGFSNKETEVLRQLAGRSEAENPCFIFSSQELFEKCIRTFVRGLKMSGEGDNPETQDFLSKLYDYRKKLEMEKPHSKNGLSNSRQISEGQFLRVLVTGVGVFTSQVVKNTGQTLTISRPVNKKMTTAMSWAGAKISVYFWRENDAGYVFDTYVEDEVFSKGVSSLKITHSDSLFRTQKRKSIRLKLHKPAFLYPVQMDDTPNSFESEPGLKCYLEDISDTGCAVIVGGKGETDLRVKVQFALSGRPVCMTGTVRSLSYKEDVNRSSLHIEADSLPQLTRNLILGEVFGTQEEYDDDLPFREIDEEAAGAGAKAVPSSGLGFGVSGPGPAPNLSAGNALEGDDFFSDMDKAPSGNFAAGNMIDDN